MDITALESAYEDFFSVLRRHGYTKEATEIEARGFGFPTQRAPLPTSEAPTTGDIGRFEEERPPQNAQPKQTPEKSIYRGQPGSAAPVLELSRIIDRVEQNPSFKKLPPNVMQGILKIKKMTSNAFKYASEKEALFGMKEEPAKELQKALLKFDKANPVPRKMPDDVKRALNNLNTLVTQYLDSQPKEKGVLEKGMDVARGVAEKGKGITQDVAEKSKGILDKGKDIAQGVTEKGQGFARGVAEKGQQIKNDFQENRERKVDEQKITTERQQSALKALKKSLFNYKVYKDIYYRLPNQIIKALEDIGLGVDDLGNAATAKVACHVNNTLLHYLRAKEAMDFSGIGNLITQKEKLDEREISRAIRLAIAAELDAVHLYELIVDSSDDETVKKVLQDISNEEKVHASELTELLNKFDKENKTWIEKGKKEVKDLLK
jgi:hypothetical protein